MLVFDTPSYMATLGWLGRPIDMPAGGFVLRAFGSAHWDARGSWPYQSLPKIALLLDARDLPQGPPLTYTAVIRPDGDPRRTQDAVMAIRDRFKTEFRALKMHVGHRPGAPSARAGYSSRTRRRLDHAARTFSVAVEALGPEHLILGQWQARLKALRAIPDDSSPDAQHFARLVALFGAPAQDVACICLRWRGTGALAGAFLFFADGGGGSWHGHSFLLDEAALADYGAYLLFDQAIALLGEREIWFGGAPAGAKGSSLLTFKQRFANCTGTAHILCVDLAEAELGKVRASSGPFPWLPDYRRPIL